MLLTATFRNTTGWEAGAGSLVTEERKPTAGGGGGLGEGSDGGDGGGGGGGNGGGDERGEGGDQNSPIRWITVATFSLPTEAHLARLKLEGEEIDCVIVDEHMIATNWLLSSALGGIKLQVPEDQALQARHVLSAVRPPPWDESEAVALATCKKCGQGEFVLASPPRWMLVVSVLLLGLPLFFLPQRWVCEACGAPMPQAE